MNKRVIIPLLITVSFLLVLISCRESGQNEQEPIPVSNRITLTLEPGKWIYYRIQDSTLVGRSDIGDEVQDLEWRERMDWDIALSESGLRTNSGTPGRGNGGFAVLTDSLFGFYDVSSLMSLKYKADTSGVTVTRPLKD